MNWDAIGAIGQAVSALALIFVLIQVQHARAEVRRSISQSRTTNSRELIMARATDERLMGILLKGSVNLGLYNPPLVAAFMEKAGLTAIEARVAFYELLAWWQHRELAIMYVHELSEGERFEFDTGVRAFFGDPLARLWYETQKPRLNPVVVRYIDNLLARPN
jgi:hypothetical protein